MEGQGEVRGLTAMEGPSAGEGGAPEGAGAGLLADIEVRPGARAVEQQLDNKIKHKETHSIEWPQKTCRASACQEAVPKWRDGPPT